MPCDTLRRIHFDDSRLWFIAVSLNSFSPNLVSLISVLPIVSFRRFSFANNAVGPNRFADFSFAKLCFRCKRYNIPFTFTWLTYPTNILQPSVTDVFADIVGTSDSISHRQPAKVSNRRLLTSVAEVRTKSVGRLSQTSATVRSWEESVTCPTDVRSLEGRTSLQTAFGRLTR